MKDENIILKLDLEVNPTTIEVYMEYWRVQIWKHGFIAISCAKDAYKKTKAFKDTKFIDLAIKHVLYR